MDSMPRIPVLLHQVHEPVLARPEDGVPASEPLSVQGNDHHLVVEPLDLVSTAVPDAFRHGTRNSLYRRLVFHFQVREVMVFDAHGEAVLLCILRHAPRYGPGDEDAVPFEAQVEVVAPGVVLLDHEPRHKRLERFSAPERSPMDLLTVALHVDYFVQRLAGPAASRARPASSLVRIAERDRGPHYFMVGHAELLPGLVSAAADDPTDAGHDTVRVGC